MRYILNIVILFMLFLSKSFSTQLDTNFHSSEEAKIYDVSSELILMYVEDQKDRTKFLNIDGGFNSDSLNKNDSIRLERVVELDQYNLLRTARDKYYASWLYVHSAKEKSHKRGIELCDEIIKSNENDTIIYLLDSSQFQSIKETYGSIFDKIENLEYNKFDNGSVVVKVPLKKRAQTLRELHNNKLEHNKDTTKVKITSEADLKKYKDEIRIKIINQLKKQFPNKSFSDKEIDTFVNREMEWIKILIEKAKKGLKSGELNINKSDTNSPNK